MHRTLGSWIWKLQKGQVVVPNKTHTRQFIKCMLSMLNVQCVVQFDVRTRPGNKTQNYCCRGFKTKITNKKF